MCATDFSGFREGFSKFRLPLVCSHPGPSCASAFDSICPSAGDESLRQMENTSLAPQSDSNPHPPPSLSQASGQPKEPSRGWREEGAEGLLLSPSRTHSPSACKASADGPPARPPPASRAASPRPSPSARLSPLPGPGENAPCCRAATRRSGFALVCAASPAGRRSGEGRRRLGRRWSRAVPGAPRRRGERPPPEPPTRPQPGPPLPPPFLLGSGWARALGLPALTPPPSPGRPPPPPSVCAL